ALHDLRRRRRRLLPPELLDQAVRGDDFVRVQEQQREQRTLPARPQLELLPALPSLERTENAEAHRGRTLPRSVPAYKRSFYRASTAADRLSTGVRDRARTRPQGAARTREVQR